MSLNSEGHAKTWRDLFDDLARGEAKRAGTITAFYDEYFAVMDMPTEFYRQTVRRIFQQRALPRESCFGTAAGSSRERSRAPGYLR